ncbi:hypothetical protein PC128_g26078 [Phytophthora cactorum]|nr:hypothetical protein PC128_g26078 [Phytophthora cactorum]
MAAKNSQGRRWCPDLSYGPRRTTPGSVLPPGVPLFEDFRAIKIEIGVSQPWGMAQGQLDHKVISIWAVMPGVEYVLCVKFDPDFSNAEYKLYDARVNPLVQLAPLPIVVPRTVIQLDGRRILGIPPGMALPIAFPATLSVDLYSPLGLFTAIQARQRPRMTRDLDELIAAVDASYWELSPATINACFLTLQATMDKCIQDYGGNAFKPAHMAKA